MYSGRKIVAAVVFLSFIVFIALFGRLPALRKTPVAYLHRLLVHRLPALFRVVDDGLTGGRTSSVLQSWSHYVMKENHPIVLIFYLVTLTASEFLFLSGAWTRLSVMQIITALLICAFPYIFTYKAVMSTSSVITVQNHHAEISRYPYDHVLYQPGQKCRTCHFLKPARSKHCSICGVCVSKHDHHCVWVMNCLGKNNYGYFVALMASLGLLLSYGSYLTYFLLEESIQMGQTDKALGAPLQVTTQHIDMNWTDKFQLWVFAFSSDVRIGGVGLLATLTAPLGWGMFVYHFYLIWAGMTTNESSKWADWRDDISDGLVFRTTKGSSGLQSKTSDQGTPSSVRWPVSSPQLLVRTTDGRLPVFIHKNNGKEQQQHWKRVQSLSEVDNLYDLGLWENLLDILPGQGPMAENF